MSSNGYNPEEDPFDPSEYPPRAGDSQGGDRKYDQVPPARRYPFIIQEWEISAEPGPSGYHYVKIASAIQTDGPWKDRWVWDNLSYSPKSNHRWSALFYALGWTPAHGKFDRTDPNVLAEWFDAGIVFHAKTKIRHDPTHGRQANIAYYISADAGEGQGESAVERPDAGQGGGQDIPEVDPSSPNYPYDEEGRSIGDPDFGKGGGGGSQDDDNSDMPF